VITYVDASVLLRVVQGSSDVLGSWHDLDPVSSVLITVECLRTIDRARLQANANVEAIARDRASAIELLRGFALAPITDSILGRAADPFPTSLGSLDAIHLATALELRNTHSDLVFATHDRQLAIAALSVGFAVEGS
jgi:predicted nucleic acid-binding protein